MKNLTEQVTEPIRIFAIVGPGYYGFGLTVRQAMAAILATGMPKKKLATCEAFQLPENAVRYGIDGMGRVHWMAREGEEAGDAIDLVWNKTERVFELPGTVKGGAL